MAEAIGVFRYRAAPTSYVVFELHSENRSTMETSPGYKYFRQVFRYSNGKAIRLY
jgi:hypothetical protein